MIKTINDIQFTYKKNKKEYFTDTYYNITILNYLNYPEYNNLTIDNITFTEYQSVFILYCDTIKIYEHLNIAINFTNPLILEYDMSYYYGVTIDYECSYRDDYECSDCDDYDYEIHTTILDIKHYYYSNSNFTYENVLW